MRTPAQTMQARLATWPVGYFIADYQGRRYGVTNSSQLDGRSRKLYAEELGGTDFVSLNLYLPTSGDPTLRPCEMPVEKVMHFITHATPRGVGAIGGGC